MYYPNTINFVCYSVQSYLMKEVFNENIWFSVEHGYKILFLTTAKIEEFPDTTPGNLYIDCSLARGTALESNRASKKRNVATVQSIFAVILHRIYEMCIFASICTSCLSDVLPRVCETGPPASTQVLCQIWDFQNKTGPPGSRRSCVSWNSLGAHIRSSRGRSLA